MFQLPESVRLVSLAHLETPCINRPVSLPFPVLYQITMACCATPDALQRVERKWVFVPVTVDDPEVTVTVPFDAASSRTSHHAP